MSAFDCIQTFKINPGIVANATEVMLTSIELFFKGKPRKNSNISGAANPGFTVWICEVENNQPLPNRILSNSVKSIGYDLINTSTYSDVATVIGFNDPVVVKSGTYYGIVIKYDDPAFDIWINKQGDRLVTSSGTSNNPSPGAQGRFDGNFYKADNSGEFNTFSDRDLKFKVNVAKFTTTNKTISLVNKDYEFFTVDTTYTGVLQGGEYVYQEAANATGTVSISSSGPPILTGNGTTFTSLVKGDKIVLVANNKADVVMIDAVTNATSVSIDKYPSSSLGTTGINFKVTPVGAVYFTDYTKNRIILVDSTANSSVKFATGNRIIGVRSEATANVASIDRWSVDHFKPSFLIGNPSTSQYSMTYSMATAANQLGSSTNLDLLTFNNATYDGYILSRSIEVDTTLSSNLFGTRRKSGAVNIDMTVNIDANNVFTVPYIKTGTLDFYFYQNDINQSTTESRNVGLSTIADYDTEIGKNGLGKSKYISKKISFAADKYAEDIVVYLQGYRPAGTEIKVYAKIHNTADKETFDDKAWTPLELKNNTDKFSSDDPNDMYEYTYGFAQYPDIQVGLTGSFLTGSSSNTITSTQDQSAVITTGDLIRVYDPLFPDNHEVFPVSSANSTAIVLFKPIVNVNLQSKDVAIDKLKYNNVAWNNIANDNTVRYVSSSLVEFDRYTSMQIKVVLLANSTYIVPKVEQLQVIGAST